MTKAKRMGQSLFKLVQEDQGRAFVSDGIDELTENEIIAFANGVIKRNKIINRKIKKWMINWTSEPTLPRKQQEP